MISVVLLTYEGRELTRRCLEAILAHPPRVRYELLVFDNGSSDGTDRMVDAYARIHPEIRSLGSPTNLGFARGCNTAARSASGGVTVFLNNDTVPQPGWLDALAGAFRAPDVVAATPLLVYPSGRVQHAGLAFALSGLPYQLGAQAAPDDTELAVARDLQASCAAALAVRTEAFDAARGFDAGYVYGYEDVDLCLQLRRRGGRIVYVPEARVVHHESATFPADRFRASGWADERRFLSLWAPVLEPEAGRRIERLRADGVRRVLVFGTGRGGERMVATLRQHGIAPCGLLDTRPEHWGGEAFGLPVLSPRAIRHARADAILIASQYQGEIRAALRRWQTPLPVLAPELELDPAAVDSADRLRVGGAV